MGQKKKEHPGTLCPVGFLHTCSCWVFIPYSNMWRNYLMYNRFLIKFLNEAQVSNSLYSASEFLVVIY